mmetsp:Transcript_24012/g.38701  ORF Transcript_24012/g.38701 Transcript_24012/m.38701 type:complete len:192 (-) Transcript_24012:479-1054(-)
MPIYPCGIIANSFFNDEYSAILIRDGNRTTLSGDNFDGSDIAWESDDDKFLNISNPDDLADVSRIGTEGNTLPLPTSQEFRVWFRVAGFPRFSKLHRKINDMDFEAGDTLELTIQNNFRVSDFDGEKHVMLSTVTILGGENFFLGSVYVIVGCLCLIYAGLMTVKSCVPSWKRAAGRMKYFSWTGVGPTAG